MVTRDIFRKLLLAGLLMLGGLQSVAAEIQVSIDRNPVQVNESFQVVFSLDYSPDREPDFSTLQQNFLILNNNRSNSISIINGKYERSVKWNLKLMAKQIGEYMVPAIRFDKERSEPFQVTVKPSSLASVPHDQLVLELLADESEAYVQSQVVVTLRLLSANNISAYQLGDILTENLDAVIEPLGDVNQYQTRIADKSYLVLEKQFAVFPQQPGRLGIAPAKAEVRLPSGSSFDPFRTGGEIRRLRSQPVFIEVKPIPEEFAGNAWLPADRVELREDWQGDLDRLVAGEPVTRTLTLVAHGLTAAQLPELTVAPIDGVKQYPDQPGLDNRRSDKGISGRRVQKVAIIPGAAGTYLVPEISLSWWNLETGKAETAKLPARELAVAAIANTVISDVVATTQPASGSDAQQPGDSRFWLWLSLFLATGWILSALYWWRKPDLTVATTDPVAELPGLRQARKRLQQACDADDATGARHALLPWGQALLAPRGVANLRQLGQALGVDFEHEIELLNQGLYAAARKPWQGQRLWKLCRQMEKVTTVERDAPQRELMPLNPTR